MHKLHDHIKHSMKKIFLFLAAVALLAVNTGCHNHEHKEEHVHAEKLQLTGYGADYEVFAVASPFVVGEESHISAHISKLSDFKPLEKGEVTATLEVGGVKTSATVKEPIEPGIFKIGIKPEKAGAGKLVFDITGENVKSQVVVADIAVFDDEHAAHEDAHSKEVSSSNGVQFSKEMSWKVDFATEVCNPMPFGEVIRTIAQIEPSQGDEKLVTAKTSGVVTFARPGLVEGAAVSAGSAIFHIDGSGMADNNLSVKLAQVESDYNYAKQNLERKKELAKDNIVSAKDLQEAERLFKSAEAEYNNLNGHFAAGKQIVTAPISGFVKQLFVKNGEFVQAGQAVASVSQNRNLYITAELQPSYYPLLSRIESANFRGLNSDKVYSVSELGGRLVSYSRNVSADSPLLPVVFQVNNNIDLLPGSFVEMFIYTNKATNCLAVPNGALVEEMGNFFVFVQLTPAFFEKRQVTIGTTDGKRVQILSGVEAGERVVSKGAVMVKLAQASGKLDAHSGHVH